MFMHFPRICFVATVHYIIWHKLSNFGGLHEIGSIMAVSSDSRGRWFLDNQFDGMDTPVLLTLSYFD